MTRQERQQMKRRNQIQRAKRRYRQRLKEKKAQQVPASTSTGPFGQRPAIDPVWAPTPIDRTPEPAQAPAHEPDPLPEPEEPEPASRKVPYIRRAAKGRKPPEPVPLACAFDPATGRRRVRIVQSDGKVIEGEVDGSGSGGIADLDWENF